MTPFTRLALLAGTSLYALGLALIAAYLSVQMALFVFAVGGALAIVVTLEFAPSATPADVEDVKPAEEEPVGAKVLVTRDRKDIERSAREARDAE